MITEVGGNYLRYWQNGELRQHVAMLLTSRGYDDDTIFKIVAFDIVHKLHDGLIGEHCFFGGRYYAHNLVETLVLNLVKADLSRSNVEAVLAFLESIYRKDEAIRDLYMFMRLLVDSSVMAGWGDSDIDGDKKLIPLDTMQSFLASDAKAGHAPSKKEAMDLAVLVAGRPGIADMFVSAGDYRSLRMIVDVFKVVSKLDDYILSFQINGDELSYHHWGSARGSSMARHLTTSLDEADRQDLLLKIVTALYVDHTPSPILMEDLKSESYIEERKSVYDGTRGSFPLF